VEDAWKDIEERSEGFSFKLHKCPQTDEEAEEMSRQFSFHLPGSHGSDFDDGVPDGDNYYYHYYGNTQFHPLSSTMTSK